MIKDSGQRQTQNDRTTWDEMDVVADKIALVFAGNQPFDILAGTCTVPVAACTRAQRLAAPAAMFDLGAACATY